MSSIPIVNMKGADVGAYDLSDDLLEFDKGLQAMQDAVVAHLANRRQGSASTKDKAEVRGSNRKLWKQKGTGRARTGSRRSPIWRGGGVVFGPRPRNFRKHVNRRVSQLAFRRAFSEKVKAGQVTVVEDLSIDQPKTRLMAEVMGNLGVEKNALLLAGDLDGNLALACRNLSDLQLELASNANTYQVLKYHRVICTPDAMKVLETRLAP